MTFDVSEFRGQTDSNFLRPTKYNVLFPVAPIMQSQGSFTQMWNSTYDLQFAADSVDLAGVSLATHNVVRYGYGVSEKKAMYNTFNDVLITFYNDGQSQNLNFFQNWIAMIANFNMSNGIGASNGATGALPYELAYKDDYAVDGLITLFDTNANAVFTVKMRRMFPVSIAETKLGWALIQDVMRVSVIFTYTDWFIDPTAGGTLFNQSTILQTQQDQNIVSARG